MNKPVEAEAGTLTGAEAVVEMLKAHGVRCSSACAADASWEAANVAMQMHGGFGFAAEYDIERKFHETQLSQIPPISTSLILSYVDEHVLGLPRSF
jgi:acyl-CoA dehydrogenase